MLTRYDPFREALSLRRAMDQLFEQSFVNPSVMPGSPSLRAPMDVCDQNEHQNQPKGQGQQTQQGQPQTQQQTQQGGRPRHWDDIQRLGCDRKIKLGSSSLAGLLSTDRKEEQLRHVRTLIHVIVGLTILFGSGLFGAVPASAATAAHVVFAQTNDPSANAVRVYDQASNGKLSFAASYATGGLGGSTVGEQPPASDPLSSQGSLTFDAADGLLFAVNAGSDTVTVFAVSGDQLRRTQVVASGGDFPVSVTVEHGLVYVLNGGGTGSVSGYRVNGDQLVPISGSIRSLGLNNTSPPLFLSSPGQVTLSPGGGQLIIPTKTNGVIDVFLINPTGRPSDTPVQNPSAGAVPFTASFDASGHLIVTEAGGLVGGKGSVSSYVLNHNGTLTTVSAAVANGQTATCWDAFSRGFLYAVNLGSSTISGYADAQGSLSLLDPSGVTAPTNAGPIDVASAGRFLYVEESLTGTLGEFSVASDGSLTRIGTITGLPVFSNGNGMEGIAAT